MRSLIAVLTFTLGLLSSVTGRATTASSRAILDEARALGTENRKTAQTRLEKLPRAELIKALREGLKAGEIATVAEAASTLHIHELSGDLENIQDSSAVLALRSIVLPSQRQAVAARLLKKAKSSDAFPFRNEVYRTLGSWQIPLSDTDFTRGLKDPVLEVRAAIVDNFLSARSSLPTATQVERFRESFRVKPAQVRLQAMVDFENLGGEERKRLAGVLDEAFVATCKREVNAEIKTECERLLKQKVEP